MKAICCGDRRDAELLLAAGTDGLTIDEVNPVWLKTPAAPMVGSLMEKVMLRSITSSPRLIHFKTRLKTSLWKGWAVG